MIEQSINFLNKFLLRMTNYRLVHSRRLIDFYLHEYRSYSEYKDIQVFHNKRKLDYVWADSSTLSIICDELRKEFPQQVIEGICHGTRNGFEQKFMSEFQDFDVIGTEISDTGYQFPNTVHWDFHDVNEEWIGKFDFVYSNSLDQGYNPKLALKTWLNQLKDNGILVIEHTEFHGPEGASEMDPFGVRPTVLPYILSEWFEWDISLKFVKSKKINNGFDVWIFFIKRLVPIIV